MNNDLIPPDDQGDFDGDQECCGSMSEVVEYEVVLGDSDIRPD